MIGWTPRCYKPSFMELKYLDPEKKIFEVRLYMGYSFEPDFMSKRSFPLSMEAQHKIWLFKTSCLRDV